MGHPYLCPFASQNAHRPRDVRPVPAVGRKGKERNVGAERKETMEVYTTAYNPLFFRYSHAFLIALVCQWFMEMRSRLGQSGVPIVHGDGLGGKVGQMMRQEIP